MNGIKPLETLYESKQGRLLPLPAELAELYGALYMPSHPDRPHVISDYVGTMDGVVSLGPPGTVMQGTPTAGMTPGGFISGFNAPDLMVLALLHAIADVLIVGDVGLRGNPNDARRAEGICPALADAYRQARLDLGKPAALPIVVISPEGDIDPHLPVFQCPDARVVILTTECTARRLKERDFPPTVQVTALPSDQAGTLSARAVLAAVEQFQPGELILSDAGPRFTAHLIAERCLDEFFLTVAPQIAGRDGSNERPGFVAGKLFAPNDARWGKLVSVKRAEHHLFLRYAL